MGSQLAQLKSKLKSAGLSRSNSNGGKKDRKKDRRAHPDVRAQRLAEIDSSLNLFDKKQSKQKFEVIGRRIPGQMGRPAQSKQAGLETRRKTLLPEMMDRHRTGGVIDRRFGEDDPNMTPEDKALARFTRERQSQRKRGSAFDLEGDAAEEGLTHYGQSLGSMLDDTDIGIVPDAPAPDPDRPRTRKEIMAEVVAKAKMHKAERQRTAGEDEDLREELDKEMAELRGLLNLPDRPRRKHEPVAERTPIPSSTDASGIDRSLLASLIGEGRSDDEGEDDAPRQSAGDDEYDRFVREFAFERRGQPSDRTKTEEELAKEASEALERAERRRLARMDGREDELSDGDAENGDGPRKRRKLARAPEADDLDDDFAASGDEDGDAYGLGKGLGVSEPLSYRVVDGETMALNGGEGDEDGSVVGNEDAEAEVIAIDGEVDDEESEEEGSEDDEEDDALGLDVDDLLSDGDEAESKPSRSSRTARPPKSRPAKPELAYTFPCPSSHDELLDILSGVERGQEATVIQRIRVLHNARLHPENSAKLQILLGVLLEHALYSAGAADFATVNAVTPHIFALSSAYPLVAAERFVDQLRAGHKDLVEGLPAWPSPADLTLLRLVGLVWSTSDLSHPVVAPALLFTCQSLAQCRVRSAADLAPGLFLCTLVLQYESMSKRVVPEVVSFLSALLLVIGPHKFTSATAPGNMPIPDAFQSGLASLKLDSTASKGMAAAESTPLDLVACLKDEGELDELTKASVLRTACTLLGRFADMYTTLEGFIELFDPSFAILASFPSSSLASQVSRSTRDALERQIRFARQARRPLRLQAHKPIPIASYAPKFEAGFAPGKHFDPDAERNEQAKLKALHRKERKGAIRELRKDNRFLAGENAKIRDQSDEAYKKKISRITSGLQTERSEQKRFERSRAADKKRAKKG